MVVRMFGVKRYVKMSLLYWYPYSSVIYSENGVCKAYIIGRFFFCSELYDSQKSRPTALRKHAYSNILKILQSKTDILQIQKFWYFSVSSPNIDCGYSLEPLRRGGSNEYPQSMFLSRNKKNNVYPCKHQFYIYKSEFKGVKII